MRSPSGVPESLRGALGSFAATRFAPGRKNYNYFEIYGSKGSLIFDLERMNELKFFSSDDPDNTQGFRTILATEKVHDYISAWWSPGHLIGYEHGFVHAVIEPNFYDGMKKMEVLDAGLRSAEIGGRSVDTEAELWYPFCCELLETSSNFYYLFLHCIGFGPW